MRVLDTGPGQHREKNGWALHRWLVFRRLTQLGILGIFLLGPLAGIWIVKGSLASSRTLDVLPLTDPYVVLQSLFAGHVPGITAITGTLIVLGAYIILGGRVYCSWVCPINIVTDVAAWCRRTLGITGNGWRLGKSTRYWILGVSLAVAAVTGTIAWELLNPVSMVYRGVLFGFGMAWIFIIGIFLFDVFVSRHGWCGHLCPVGAFYSIPGQISLLRVSAIRRDQCNDCMDCFRVCPEPQVIKPALKPDTAGSTPLILSGNCTNCFRCLDVCNRDVFSLTQRFDHRTTPVTTNQGEAMT